MPLSDKTKRTISRFADECAAIVNSQIINKNYKKKMIRNSIHVSNGSNNNNSTSSRSRESTELINFLKKMKRFGVNLEPKRWSAEIVTKNDEEEALCLFKHEMERHLDTLEITCPESKSRASGGICVHVLDLILKLGMYRDLQTYLENNSKNNPVLATDLKAVIILLSELRMELSDKLFNTDSTNQAFLVNGDLKARLDILDEFYEQYSENNSYLKLTRYIRNKLIEIPKTEEKMVNFSKSLQTPIKKPSTSFFSKSNDPKEARESDTTNLVEQYKKKKIKSIRNIENTLVFSYEKILSMFTPCPEFLNLMLDQLNSPKFNTHLKSLCNKIIINPELSALNDELYKKTEPRKYDKTAKLIAIPHERLALYGIFLKELTEAYKKLSKFNYDASCSNEIATKLADVSQKISTVLKKINALQKLYECTNLVNDFEKKITRCLPDIKIDEDIKAEMRNFATQISRYTASQTGELEKQDNLLGVEHPYCPVKITVEELYSKLLMRIEAIKDLSNSKNTDLKGYFEKCFEKEYKKLITSLNRIEASNIKEWLQSILPELKLDDETPGTQNRTLHTQERDESVVKKLSF